MSGMGQNTGHPLQEVWSGNEGMALEAPEGRLSAGYRTDGFGVTSHPQGQRKHLGIGARRNLVQSRVVGRTVLPVCEACPKTEESLGKAGHLRLPQVSKFPTRLVAGHVGRWNSRLLPISNPVPRGHVRLRGPPGSTDNIGHRQPRWPSATRLWWQETSPTAGAEGTNPRPDPWHRRDRRRTFSPRKTGTTSAPRRPPSPIRAWTNVNPTKRQSLRGTQRSIPVRVALWNTTDAKLQRHHDDFSGPGLRPAYETAVGVDIGARRKRHDQNFRQHFGRLPGLRATGCYCNCRWRSRLEPWWTGNRAVDRAT
jgi:hypothetical protein